MADHSGNQTRLSLLSRLRTNPDNPSAWDEFVRRYGPQIRAWCRAWGLQEADAEDITQMVLVRLAVKLRGFVYDPGGSFRAWLKTLARHAWNDFVADRERAVAGEGGSGMFQVLHSVEARDDLEKRLEEAFDLELLELATERVRAGRPAYLGGVPADRRGRPLRRRGRAPARHAGRVGLQGEE